MFFCFAAGSNSCGGAAGAGVHVRVLLAGVRLPAHHAPPPGGEPQLRPRPRRARHGHPGAELPRVRGALLERGEAERSRSRRAPRRSGLPHAQMLCVQSEPLEQGNTQHAFETAFSFIPSNNGGFLFADMLEETRSEGSSE